MDDDIRKLHFYQNIMISINSFPVNYEKMSPAHSDQSQPAILKVSRFSPAPAAYLRACCVTSLFTFSSRPTIMDIYAL